MSLTTKGHFKIGSTEYVAKSIKVDYESLASEESGRTDDGVMHIDMIKKKLRKVEIEMPPIKEADLATKSPLSLVQGQIYNMTFYDPLSHSEITVSMYTGNSKSDCYSGVLYNGLWQGIAFNAIDMGSGSESD